MAQTTPATGAKSGITTAAVQLIAASTPCKYGVWIKAATSNAGQVYVGLSTVTKGGTADATDGYELVAKDAYWVSPDFCGGDASNIYVIASAASQVVYFLIP